VAAPQKKGSAGPGPGDAGPELHDLPPPAPRDKTPTEEEEPPGAPEWVVTFTDMISLLVTFFVLLMTFSSMEEHDLLRMQGLIQGNKGVIQNTNGQRMIKQPPLDQVANTDPLQGAQEPHTRPPEELPEDSSELARREEPDQITVQLNDIQDGLLIEWSREAGFAPGSALISSQLAAELSQVAEVLTHYPHQIVIEGHDDSAFEGSASYADSTALSLARAIAAARLLVDIGVQPGRIQLAAYGSARPRALNDTPSGRAQNRRIGVRVLSLPRNRELQLKLEREQAAGR
jgi:chemotaxis protein MotB